MSITYDPVPTPELEEWKNRMGTARAVFELNKQLDERDKPVIGDATFRVWLKRRVPAELVSAVVAASGLPAKAIRPDIFGS